MQHLRDYQRQALTDLIKRWDSGATRVPLVLATGLGKTEIFTALENAWVGGGPEQLADPLNSAFPLHEIYGLGRRVLVLAHTDELIEQAARKARMRNPHLSVGIVKAGRNEAHAQIVVSSRQTLQSARRREQIRNVGLIIVDEAHHTVRTNTYGKILEHFGAFDPCPQAAIEHDCAAHGGAGYVKVAGFTATLARSDKAKLSSVWEDCTFRRDILFGIRHGYLLDVRGERVVVPDFDLRNVKKVAGDYSDSGLAEEMERTYAPQIIAKHYLQSACSATSSELLHSVRSGQEGGPAESVGVATGQATAPLQVREGGTLRKTGLRQGIAFWPLVETAYHGAEAFEEQGISSAVIHGALPKEERRLILKRFLAGEITVIHNCMVLTEGFDAPNADVVVVARPTSSAALYQQMVGRVLRPDLTVPAEQREKALILDVCGAGARHDLCSLVDLSPERPLRESEDGQLSLLELDDLAIQDEERGQTAAVFDDPTWEQYAGETAVVAFDPLHRDRAWRQTPGGTFYTEAGTEKYIFLAESAEGDPGTWDVVWCSKSGPHTWPRMDNGPAGLTQYTGLSLEEALECAEDAAAERGGFATRALTSRKGANYRKPPTEAQLRAARAAGIVVPMREGVRDLIATTETSAWTRGVLSERLDAVKAAQRIDPLVALVKASQQQ